MDETNLNHDECGLYQKIESPVDLSRLCRMCGEPCTVVTSIEILTPNPKLVSQLLHYFGILLSKNDGLPTRICQGCISELDRWEQVKSSVQRGQEFLLKQLEVNKSGAINEPPPDIFDENFSEVSVTENMEDTCSEHSEDTQQFCSVTLPEATSKPSTSTMKETFTCSICTHKFKTHDKYLQHVAFHTSDGKNMKMTKQRTQENLKHRAKRPVSPTHPYCCGVCPEKFKYQIKLAQHLHTHFKENKFQKVFPCAHCKIVFKNISLLVTHQKKHISHPTAQFVYSCTLCDKQFSTSTNLKTHMRTHQIVFEFKCSNCAAEFKYKNQLVEHVTKVHPNFTENNLTNKSPNCGLCSEEFHSFTDLAHHLNVVHKPFESNYKIVPCGNCNLKFKAIADVVKHFRSHLLSIQEKTEVCEFCLRKFSDSETVQSHIKKVHLKEKVFHDCSLCKSIFSDLNSLKEHVSKSHVENPTQTVTSDELTLEVENHDSIICIDSPIAFEIEGELTNFESKIDLVTEKNDNIDEEALTKVDKIENLIDQYDESLVEKSQEFVFFCCHCKTNFVDFDTFSIHAEQELQKHGFIECGICATIFNELEVFFRHVAIHAYPEKVTSIECSICFENFDNSQNYNYHRKLHLNHTNQTEFKFKKSLKKHINIEHNDEPWDELLDEIPELNNAQDNVLTTRSESMLPKVNEKSCNFSCGLCHVTFQDISSFSIHIKSEFNALKRKQIPCNICESVFRKAEALVKHTKEHVTKPNKKLSHQCGICYKKFHKKTNYNSHMHMHVEHLRFQCKLCENKYRHKYSWKLHFHSHHSDFIGEEKDALKIVPPPKPNNAVVNVTDNSKNIVPSTSVVQTSETVSRYSCDICNEKFVASDLLYQHLINIHIIEHQFNCEICSQLFTSTDELQTHLRMHSKVRKYFCQVCEKSFKYSGSLKNHLYLHSTERPFACDLCDRRYRSRNALYYHTKRDHEKQMNAMCEYCSKMFFHKSDLRKHMFSHTGISSFMCEICGKYFDGLSKLKEHVFVHSNEKPLRCIKCNKGFIYSKNWRLHMRKNCQVPEDQIPYTRPRFAKTQFIEISNF